MYKWRGAALFGSRSVVGVGEVGKENAKENAKEKRRNLEIPLSAPLVWLGAPLRNLCKNLYHKTKTINL